MPVKEGVRAFTHTRRTHIELPEAVIRELEARLRDDAARLRELWLEPPFEDWELLDAGRTTAGAPTRAGG